MYFGLDVPSGVLGEAQVIDIDADNEDKYISKDNGYFYGDVTVTIEYSCGRFHGTIISKTNKEKTTWTPPIELAEENPTGSYVYVTLTLTAYSGSKVVNQDSVDVYYSIPSSVVPDFTVDFSDDAGYKDIYGDFIQLMSKLKVKVNPITYYGATVNMCRITIGNETFADLQTITTKVDAVGDVKVYVSITDSRNRTTQKEFSISFRGYSVPAISSFTVKRCDINGSENDQGEYVQVKFAASAETMDNLNTVAYKLEYKKSTDSKFTVVELSQFTNDFDISDETYIFAAATGSSYNVQFTVTDAFYSVVKTTIASTAATIMHFKANGHGIGLGKVSEVDNAVDVGWNINMNSNRITGLADPVEDRDAVSKAFLVEFKEQIKTEIYPVGAIYLSVSYTSPANLFGGTWERIQDRFLLAAGETFTAGITGGEVEHTLTIDEMPSHTHGGVRRAYVENSGGASLGVSAGGGGADNETGDKGGNQPHNNMPPYLVVYVWKRIA